MTREGGVSEEPRYLEADRRMTRLETRMDESVATKEWVRTEIEEKLKQHMKDFFASQSWVYRVVWSAVGIVAVIAAALATVGTFLRE